VPQNDFWEWMLMMSKRCFCVPLIVCVLLSAGRICTAGEAETAALSMALKVESELTSVIARASNAFAFVGLGSGVVISPDGYILSNHHVAGERKQWTVRIYGTARFFVCDLVGTDPVGDLCLLKARNAENLPFVEAGDIFALKVGQQCLTIGDPFKLADPWDAPPSVSIGTISALHRFQQNYCDAIQTDAAINPGNSGGPLVTLDGKLIGITGQIMSRFLAKANTGIGYAIPIDQINRFIPLLKKAEGKFVYHGTIPDGVVFTQSSIDDVQAAVVESVEPGSEGELLDFQKGDKVLRVDDRPVLNYWRLRGIIQSYPEGTKVSLVVVRRGKEVPINFALPRMPLPPAPAYVEVLGIKVVPTAAGDGLLIKSLVIGGLADRSGLLKDDVILKIGGKQPVANWQEALQAKRPGDQISLDVRRRTATAYVVQTHTITIPAR